MLPFLVESFLLRDRVLHSYSEPHSQVKIPGFFLPLGSVTDVED